MQLPSNKANCRCLNTKNYASLSSVRDIELRFFCHISLVVADYIVDKVRLPTSLKQASCSQLITGLNISINQIFNGQ